METFKKYLIKLYPKTHQIALFFKTFSEELAPEYFSMLGIQGRDMQYTLLEKLFCMPLVNSVMYAHLSPFGEKNDDRKGPVFTIFKSSTSIHKCNPALVVSIVLQKYYFHGICGFSIKKNS